jgi:hypothetical protein
MCLCSRPVTSQQSQSVWRQEAGAVRGALPAVDGAHQARCVDSGHLPQAPVVAPESHTGEGGEGARIVLGGGRVAEPPALVGTEDGGQAACGGSAPEGQGMPVTCADVRGAAPEATGAETPGSRGEAIAVCAGQAVLLSCRF